MPASPQKKLLHPEAIKRIARLDLRARHIVEGFMSGMHRSPYFGQSVEFLQHRQYVAGDDLRHVDWKVWARQDRLYIKQFEEDTNLRCTLLADLSASMHYGSGPLNKHEYAATLVATLAWWVLSHQDAVGCVAFDDEIRATAPIRSKRNHLHTILEVLSTNQPQEKTDLFGVLRFVAENYPRRGMVILVSDLLADVAGTIKGLKQLRKAGHDVMVFHILDDDELDFPFSGPMRFEGLESDDFLNCNPRALREGYMEALTAYLEQIRRECARNTVDYALIRTSDPLDAALAKCLTNRLGMHHRN